MSVSTIRVAKRFKWEAAHRIPGHAGLCRNFHGHSYRMFVEVEGTIRENGMVMDFHDIKQLVEPLVDQWDHAVLVGANDQELLEIINKTDWKHFVFPGDTTAELIVQYVLDFLSHQKGDLLRQQGMIRLRVKVRETETSYAEGYSEL